MIDVLHAAGVCPCHSHLQEATVAASGFAGLVLVVRYAYYRVRDFVRGLRG